MNICLQKSSRPDKKYQVRIDNKTIHFGSSGASDLPYIKTMKEKRYIQRHTKRENWNKSGIKTAGF